MKKAGYTLNQAERERQDVVKRFGEPHVSKAHCAQNRDDLPVISTSGQASGFTSTQQQTGRGGKVARRHQQMTKALHLIASSYIGKVRLNQFTLS